jgi:hypothetical protein
VSEKALEGNGAALVREVALASRIQGGLERLYRLERAADVDGFVTGAEGGEREALLVRETDGVLELRLRVPRLERDAGMDPLCQIIEGVSHFVYLSHRASLEREATQLEMELQAEVDKYVVLAASIDAFDETTSWKLRERLYERVTFLHEEGTEEGERYRIANASAHRFVARLEKEYVTRNRFAEMRDELRRFFHAGQSDKLRAA